MNSLPKKVDISVVIPVHNGRKYLKKAIDSVLKQQGVNLELIIIDDASDDNTAEVVNSYRKESKMRYVRNRKNIGAAESRNRGVRLAAGEYIAFLDADDWWEPDKLKKQMQVIHDTGTVLTYTGRKIHKGDREQMYYVPSSLTYEDLLQCNYIACSSVVMERKTALKYPMQSDAEIHEDYLTWLQILKEHGTVYGLSECCLNYLVHRDSRSGAKLHSVMMRGHTYRKAGLSRLMTLKYNIGYYGRWLTGFRKEIV